MVANEISSGQVDVFVGVDSRWTRSSVGGGISSTCRTPPRLSDERIRVDAGGGVVGGGESNATARTTPPGGDGVNLSRHDGWVDTRPKSDIGPSETDENSLPSLVYRSSIQEEKDEFDSHPHRKQLSEDCQIHRDCVRHHHHLSNFADEWKTASVVVLGPTAATGPSFVQSEDGSLVAGLRISLEPPSPTDGDSSATAPPVRETAEEFEKVEEKEEKAEENVEEEVGEEYQVPEEKQEIHIGIVNDALDAPERPDDQQLDDKMPHQSHPHHPHDSGSHAHWAIPSDGDESSCLPVCSMHPPLKSALKRPTNSAIRGGVAGLQALRKKSRVRFNEALNTFLECDYVIYVDDDEYDLLYHLDAVAAAAAAAAAAQQAAAQQAAAQQAEAESNCSDPATLSTEQPQLVNVRSFELQLPETSLTSVSHATANNPATRTGGDNPSQHGGSDALTLSPPDGYKDAAAFYAAAAALVDLENSGCVDDGADPWEEEYEDEDAMADEAEANGWLDSQTEPHESSVVSSSSNTEVVTPLPDPPRTGILKGGKLWRGSVNNNNNSNSNGSNNSQNNSSSAPSTTLSSVSVGGEESNLTRHGEKSSPAVRFIHLNDSQSDSCDSGGSAGGQQTQKGGGHHSAFQQLFPRARKLLQELPEAEIQRLTTAARANNAPSAVSARAVTTLLTHSTDTASDLKYEKALRVTEKSEETDESSHPVVGGAAARLGLQYSADYYQVIKRIRSSAGGEVRHQRKTDPPSTDSLVERLKWLTTDVDDPEESGVAEEREAADGGSDPEILNQLATYATMVAQQENAALMMEDQEIIRTSANAETQPQDCGSNQGMGAASGSASAGGAGAAVVAKPAKSSSGGSEKSTYRKLNELFFRSKSKDKNKDGSNKSSDQWKNPASALNRSFSPPPPAEVEPKMKPSKKPHLIHIVGLSGGKSASSGPGSGETLGRIPNVVPTVDHVYRAAVDLVTRNSHQAGLVSGLGVGEGQSSGSGTESYSLDDIDAALHAQMAAAAASASTGVGAGGGGAEACLYLPAHRIPEDSRDETGGSRSSGSSGDSGLGSSHDTSLTGTDTDGSAQDELQAFVRQDATQGRIDRIKKRYSAALEDEAEDYGFLRRPSVRGIKTRFGSTSEIIQQMQAQLAPMPAVTAAKAAGQTHVSWASYAEAEQSSIQAQALLDPREKRRSAMVAMTNSVHLPALPEDSYFQQAGSTTGNPIRRDIPSRPASVMNIYGSTGDLYQHLRAPIRPMIVRHPPSSSTGMAGMPGMPVVNPPPSHLLERTSSVSSVSSALDGSGIYGTIRRQPPQMVHPTYVQAHPESVSPTREYVPAVMVQQQMQQQQMQHHQIPLRMTVSTPAGYLANPQQQQPQQQPQRPATQVAYYTAQDYAMQQQYQQQQQHHHQQHHHHQQQQQQHYLYATLPVKRQSPYGVPAPVTSQPLDPTRYRQVLPPMSSQVALRPTSTLTDPRYSVPAHGLQTQPAAPSKDEREGPEGASSSPGLTHHDVNM